MIGPLYAYTGRVLAHIKHQPHLYYYKHIAIFYDRIQEKYMYNFKLLRHSFILLHIITLFVDITLVTIPSSHQYVMSFHIRTTLLCINICICVLYTVVL